jgi:DNA-binding NarL/FixJ family response regulator
MIVAKKARAYGFIPKKAAGYDLITGMRTVDAGKYFPASFAEVSKNQRSGMGRFAGL